MSFFKRLKDRFAPTEEPREELPSEQLEDEQVQPLPERQVEPPAKKNNEWTFDFDDDDRCPSKNLRNLKRSRSALNSVKDLKSHVKISRTD